MCTPTESEQAHLDWLAAQHREERRLAALAPAMLSLLRLVVQWAASTQPQSMHTLQANLDWFGKEARTLVAKADGLEGTDDQQV